MPVLPLLATLRWRIAAAMAYGVVTMTLLSTPAAAAIMSYADFRRLPQPTAPRILAYGRDPLQHVELWTPLGKGPFPVVLLIHGGCWQTDVAKADIMHRMADTLMARGVAVWSVEYRGVDVAGGGYPGTFQDVARAADLLRDDGAKLGLDTDRVVAVGHSAGGHLALWLAGRHRIALRSVLSAQRPLRLTGVVSQGGLPDLADARTAAAEACGADTIDRLVGPITPAHPDVFADTSPVSLAPLGVSQVMISGGKDPIAPPRFAEGYAAKARATGDAVSVATIPDQGHFELITPGTPAGDAVIDAILRLLDKRAR
jgi:acetyl esterase/lipase